MTNMVVMVKVKLEDMTADEIAMKVRELRDVGDLEHAAELEAVGDVIRETAGAHMLADVFAALGTECTQARALQVRAAAFARHGLTTSAGADEPMSKEGGEATQGHEATSVRGLAATSHRAREVEEEETMDEPKKETMGKAIDVLKYKVRAAAAQLPRPIPLHEAAIAISKQLSAVEMRLVVIDTVGEWIFSDTEPFQQGDAGLVLCGPAARADDEAAWDGGGF